MTPNFRRDAIRSKSLRAAAKGQRCTLNFKDICSYNSETVVLAHIRDETHGRGIKADDTSACFACHACHTALDQSRHGLDDGTLSWTLLRAMQRTIRIQVLMGNLAVAHDAPMEHRVKPRKPKASRPIQSRPFPEQSRPLRSRNNLRKETAS